MTISCSAIYEKGVLRLKQPLDLREGSEVNVIVVGKEPADDQRTIAALISEIAAMPLETNDQGFSGRDHDHILYGDTGKQ